MKILIIVTVIVCIMVVGSMIADSGSKIIKDHNEMTIEIIQKSI